MTYIAVQSTKKICPRCKKPVVVPAGARPTCPHCGLGGNATKSPATKSVPPTVGKSIGTSRRTGAETTGWIGAGLATLGVLGTLQFWGELSGCGGWRSPVFLDVMILLVPVGLVLGIIALVMAKGARRRAGWFALGAVGLTVLSIVLWGIVAVIKGPARCLAVSV